MLLSGLILKCFKACMTIIIFTLNGTSNDYFVIIFFLTTTVCGLTYLDKAGYSIPPNPSGEEEEDKVEELKRRIVIDTIMKEQDVAFWRILTITMISFMCSLYLLLYSKPIFGNDVTTMGTSASIMILSNLISWPSLLEEIRQLPPIG